MIYRILLSSVTILTLATCKNQSSLNTQKTELSENKKVISKSEPDPSSQKAEAKTTIDLPGNKKATPEDGKQTRTSTKGMIYLKEGENKFLKEYEMNVTFIKMKEDSRCPKDAQCIWAGNAIAEVEFMGTYTRPVTVHLSTANDTDKGYSTTEKFNGYSITLADVTPQTTSAKGFKSLKGSYQIALKFEKDNSSDSPTARGGITTR